MRLFYTRAFKRDYRSLSKEIRAQADKQLMLFAANPRHPSLRVKKVQGTSPPIWEARVSRGYRFTFQWEDDAVILRRIGGHEVIDRESRT